MADIDREIAGLMRRFTDVGVAANGRPTYAEGVALAGGSAGGIAGQEVTNDRGRVEFKPVDADSILEILQDAVLATGNGAASNMKGYSAATVTVTLAGTATATFQGTIDDTNWFTIGLLAVATGVIATTATATGQFYLPPGLRLSQFRVPITWTSGASSVLIRKHPR